MNAIDLQMQRLIEDQQANYGVPRDTEIIACPKRMVGRVIGKNGETIKALQLYTGAQIQIDQRCDPTRVSITGPTEALHTATNMVQDIVAGTFKGFAMLRSFAHQPNRPPELFPQASLAQPFPMYLQGYGFIPPSQAVDSLTQSQIGMDFQNLQPQAGPAFGDSGALNNLQAQFMSQQPSNPMAQSQQIGSYKPAAFNGLSHSLGSSLSGTLGNPLMQAPHSWPSNNVLNPGNVQNLLHMTRSQGESVASATPEISMALPIPSTNIAQQDVTSGSAMGDQLAAQMQALNLLQHTPVPTGPSGQPANSGQVFGKSGISNTTPALNSASSLNNSQTFHGVINSNGAPNGSVPSPGLYNKWMVIVSPEGKTMYHNVETSTSQYEMPAELSHILPPVTDASGPNPSGAEDADKEATSIAGSAANSGKLKLHGEAVSEKQREEDQSGAPLL